MPAPPSGAAPSAPVGRDRFDGWRPRSLRARQLLAASLALLAFLALAGYALDRAFVDTAEDNLRQRLKSYALYYTDKVEFGRNGTLIPPYNTPDPRFDMPDSGMYAQVVLQGVPPWGSNSTLGPELPVPRMLGALEESFEGPLPIRRADGSESEAYRYGVGYAWPATHQHAEIPYSIYIFEDAQALSAQIRVFRGSLWVYLGGAGVILLLLQMLVLRWSLRPLRRVIFELSRVQRGELSGMTESHPRELEPLTDSINAFIESERENLERQRNTLADLAHSLKTPIAVLRTQLDSGGGDPQALIGSSGTTKFANPSLSGYTYRLNGVEYAQSNLQAPMAVWGIVHVRCTTPYEFANGIQFGKNRTTAGTFAEMDVAEIILSNQLLPTNIGREITEYLTVKYAIT